MNKHRGKRINWMMLLRLLGIGLFVLLLLKIDLADVWLNLKKADTFLFVLALFFQIIMLLLKGVRWHLLKGGTFQFKNFSIHLGTFLESYAIGVVTPGRFGEFSKAGHEKSRNTRWNSVLKIVAERGFDLGIFIIIAGLASAIYYMLPMYRALNYGAIVIGIVLIIFSFTLLSGKRLKAYLSNKLRKSSRFTRFITLNFNLNLSQVSQIFFLSILSNASIFVSCYLLAVAINLGSNFLFTSGGVAVAGLLNLLPITIMGLGTRELSLIYLFNQFDVSLVMAFSFLMFTTLQVGGGLISLIFGQILIYLNKKRN